MGTSDSDARGSTAVELLLPETWEMSPPPVPPVWSHPLFWPPATILLLLAASCAAYLLPGQASRSVGVAGFFVTLAVALAYIASISVTLALGSTCSCPCQRRPPRRSPKPEASAAEEAREPMTVNTLKVGAGIIGMSAAPGRWPRSLAGDVAHLAQVLRFDVVVTLMEDRELEYEGLSDVGSQVAAAGMDWFQFPMRDKWIPLDTASFLSKLVRPMCAWLREGKRVLVHCHGGKGRTGTAVAAVLLTSVGDENTETLGQAIERMRASRPGMLKNPWQQLYLRHLHSCLRQM